MTRPDPAPHFIAASLADTTATRLAALDAATKATIGHKLFTVLVLNWDRGENQRYYSNMPDAYLVGGSKPITAQLQARLMEGECRFLNDYEEIKAVFFDHELIRSLGCESCVNVPIRWGGTTIGMMNLLHDAHWYTKADVPTLQAFAALAVPAVKDIIAAW